MSRSTSGRYRRDARTLNKTRGLRPDENDCCRQGLAEARHTLIRVLLPVGILPSLFYFRLIGGELIAVVVLYLIFVCRKI